MCEDGGFDKDVAGVDSHYLPNKERSPIDFEGKGLCRQNEEANINHQQHGVQDGSVHHEVPARHRQQRKQNSHFGRLAGFHVLHEMILLID